MNWLSDSWPTEIDTRHAPRELSPDELALLRESLPNLSVDPATASRLLRLRWLAMVTIAQPDDHGPVVEHQIVSAVESRLQGREPVFFVEGNRLHGWFSTASANDVERQQAEGFAQAVAGAIGATATRVVIGNTHATKYDSWLPVAERPEPYRGASS